MKGMIFPINLAKVITMLILKYLFIFFSGFVAGVFYCLYRDIFSHQPQPVLDYKP